MAKELTFPSGQEIMAYQTALIESGGIKVAEDPEHLYQMRSGPYSWVYVDHAEMLCQPETFSPLSRVMGSYLEENFPNDRSVLVNVDSKVSPQLTGALAAIHGYRQIAVNPEQTTTAERGANLRFRFPRNLNQGDTFVLVDDVFTVRDATATDVANLLRPEIEKAVKDPQFELVVGLLRGDRNEAVKQLERVGIRLSWFLDLKSLIGEVLVSKQLTPFQRAGIDEELSVNS